MQEYREYLKYNLKYAGIWNIMEYNAHIPNIVDDFASDGPLGCSLHGRNGDATIQFCCLSFCFSCIQKGLEKGRIELIKLRNSLLKSFRRLRTQVKIF